MGVGRKGGGDGGSWTDLREEGGGSAHEGRKLTKTIGEQSDTNKHDRNSGTLDRAGSILSQTHLG